MSAGELSAHIGSILGTSLPIGLAFLLLGAMLRRARLQRLHPWLTIAVSWFLYNLASKSSSAVAYDSGLACVLVVGIYYLSSSKAVNCNQPNAAKDIGSEQADHPVVPSAIRIDSGAHVDPIPSELPDCTREQTSIPTPKRSINWSRGFARLRLLVGIIWTVLVGLSSLVGEDGNRTDVGFAFVLISCGWLLLYGVSLSVRLYHWIRSGFMCDE